MDWNRIEEHWKKLKGKIKQQWESLEPHSGSRREATAKMPPSLE